MNTKYSYPELFMRLGIELATIIFLKKNGDFRVMLGTRNLRTVELKYGFQGAALGGHDNRCNINNGNIAVFDMLLGEARSFNVERLVDIEFYGEIRDEAGLDDAVERFEAFKDAYEKRLAETSIKDEIFD